MRDDYLWKHGSGVVSVAVASGEAPMDEVEEALGELEIQAPVETIAPRLESVTTDLPVTGTPIVLSLLKVNSCRVKQKSIRCFTRLSF